MLQHTVLFLYRDWLTEEHKAGMLDVWEGIRSGCGSIRALDVGVDLQGGSSELLQVLPWRRTPIWHSRRIGPPSNYDIGSNVDFDDLAGFATYGTCPAHHEASVYNETHGQEERAARIQWEYDGPPRFLAGGVRHTALYLWAEEATAEQRSEARNQMRALADSVPGARSLAVGDDLKLGHLATEQGTRLVRPADVPAGEEAWASSTNFDLIVDVMFEDLQGANAFIEHPARREAEAMLAGATMYEWTARVTKRMVAV